MHEQLDLSHSASPLHPGSNKAGSCMDNQLGRYVAHREASGILCSESAGGLRCKLRSFAARWPNLEPSRITKRHIEGWMETPGLSPAYRRSRLSAVRGFTRWLVDQGVLAKDPCHGVAAPRQPRYAPRNLSRAEIGLVLARCDPRLRVAVLLMCQEGLRRVEVARAEMGDIDWHRGTIAVRGKGGHGQLTRVVPMSEETVAAINRYLAEEPHGAGPLIRSRIRPELGLSAPHLGELITDVMRDAGVKLQNGDQRSPHSFRHSAAVDILDQCADITVVQAVLGHATVKSTEVYTAGRVTHLREPMAGRSYAL